MQIKTMPQNYASLCSPLRYTFTDTVPRTFDVKIIDANTDEVVGAKRLRGVTQATVDAAPFLRRRLAFRPSTGPTEFVSALGRTVAAKAEVDGVTAPLLIFVPAPEAVVPPALLTTFHGPRRIGHSECEELTLCTASPCKIRVVSSKEGTEIKTAAYTAPSSGFVLFRLNTSEFPDADLLRIFIEGYSMLTFHFTNYKTGHRLAWRSSAGSIEHYTFSVEKETSEKVAKEQLLSDTGYQPISIRSRQYITLFSDYEPQRVLAPLAEIISSPEVWSVKDGTYIPVEVVGDSSGIRRKGTLCNLEVQIRFQPHTHLP